MAKAGVEDWIGAVDRAAGEASRSLALLLTVCLVFLATVIETTHQDIFLNTSKPLPQIGTRLPLIGIFVVVPFAIAVLHLVAVLQVRGLVLRTRNLMQAMDVADDVRPPLTLPPALIVQWIVARDGGRATVLLTSFLVLTILVIIPLGTLLAAQIRFLPYHSELVTWLHRVLIGVDVAALFTVFVLGWWRPREHGGRAAWDRGLSPSFAWSTTAGGVAFAALLASLLLVTVPGEALERRVVAASDRVFGVVARADEPAACDGWTWRPWSYVRVTEVPAPGEPTPRRMLCAVHLLAEHPETSFPFLRRNLVLREARLLTNTPPSDLIASFGEAEAWRAVAGAIVVAGRDLRYADLTGVHLRGVDLRAADLTGAKLNWARLEFADLGDAAFDEVGGCPDYLRIEMGSRLYCRTRLMAADLGDARLQGARLWKAQMAGAALGGAQLVGADLRYADLRDLNLAGLDLTGVDLSGAKLGGTNLAGTDLRGAKLVGAHLEQANLVGTRLDGADLRGATIVVGVNARGQAPALADVRAAGADLRGTNLVLVDADDTTSRPVRLARVGEPVAVDAATMLAWVKEGPFANVDLVDAQLQGLTLLAIGGPLRGAFGLGGAGDPQVETGVALAQRLGALACRADRPGVILGITDRVVAELAEPQLHHYLLARQLQRRDCDAAVVLDDDDLCRLRAVERRYERYAGPRPEGVSIDSALGDGERRLPSRPCKALN